MEIRAYSELYLDDAQNHLGQAFDFALLTLGYSPSDFSSIFMVSDVSHQFEQGNPKYIAGMNGCELTRLILQESGIGNDAPDEIYLDKSPEYWSGWILAFYQWYSSKTFTEILSAVSLDDILKMYPVYHEMDPLKFADAMNARIFARQPLTKLRLFRQINGLSQSELSRQADVPLRQIQQFEQRKRDINKAQSITLLKLSRALHCTIEELIETGSFNREADQGRICHQRS
jgi:DNA-binding transcriptional regulator YiaG